MTGIRLRTKFLLSLLLVSAGLTCGSLLAVHHVLKREIQREIFTDLETSVLSFQNSQHQRELGQSRSAELFASLPTLRALMTTRDRATIQDASADLWRLAGSDLFMLADRSGKVVALHTKGADLRVEFAQASLNDSLANDESIHWWFSDGHLYEVFLHPIYFGPPADNNLLGLLAMGYEIDAPVAAELSRTANSYVAFQYGNSLVISTLIPAQNSDLIAQMRDAPGQADVGPSSVNLRGEKFLLKSLPLGTTASAPVRLVVLKSYDQATAFLRRLDHLLLALGLIAVAGGSLLVVMISHTFTRPLKNLVLGVRSLERGDFAYKLKRHGDDEVAEVTAAFDRMRRSLQLTQQQLLEAERLATIGQMAASISHDLRHSLTAIVANAEFLCEQNLVSAQREELYQEVRVAVDQMTDLVDSLLEFSKTRESLRPVQASLEASARRAIYAVRAHPEFHQVKIELSCDGSSEGWFDPRKIERVFYNLFRNACESMPSLSGAIRVNMQQDSSHRIFVRVADSGSGIPNEIRDKLFQPFVSYGKENGTGLGLAVVQKIVLDHGGEIVVERTSAEGTVFRLMLPVNFPATAIVRDKNLADSLAASDQ